uniref:FAD-binding PCMH-type domain-containing protein n=1 Tax=Chromera velia CCMP2878 TaxID=1169474 RepID=A0A0G4H3Q1_9ALVE|eukprot:Cvel_24584.t1-p1 / transcript=Cvel_24584.t1 / gene=Cvel_24584 / organism=Chromera_velia_CCMP2878 / gene_product=D-lactate dehydrogenase, putative / transcript_product=D-lactate dehydrogenase, putative / location=Cvel_scaffold2676:295-5313(+) / protein_length=633 / sequence_SO=supercontig / SO=protein_coding / is_pseudo=false
MCNCATLVVALVLAVVFCKDSTNAFAKPRRLPAAFLLRHLNHDGRKRHLKTEVRTAGPSLLHALSTAPSPLSTKASQSLLANELRGIVGADSVEENVQMRGYRGGKGTADILSKPSTLTEAAVALSACAKAGVAVLLQGANTGLTGGSVPNGETDERMRVVLNLRRLSESAQVDGGQRVLCHAGMGITSLAKVRKGPAFTERALYCAVESDFTVRVVNSLGIEGIPDGEWQLEEGGLEVIEKVEDIAGRSFQTDPGCRLLASDTTYGRRLAHLDGELSRYNADTRGPRFSRSEGKVLILASVHDTFPEPLSARTLWVSVDSLSRAHALKDHLLGAERAVQKKSGGRLKMPKETPLLLPSSIEYMNADTVDTTDEVARFSLQVINQLGLYNDALRQLFGVKAWFESLPFPGALQLPNKILSFISPLFPPPLASEVEDLRKSFSHHLLIDLGDYGHKEDEQLQDRILSFVEEENAKAEEEGRGPAAGIYESVSSDESKQLAIFRFVAAAAFQMWADVQGACTLSLDYALPKNEEAEPPLPVKALRRLRYAHYGCNVVHDDIAFPASAEKDIKKIKAEIRKTVEEMGGRLPSEHGHGTEYEAPPDTQARWRDLDPTNTFLPGLGGLPKTPFYRGTA